MSNKTIAELSQDLHAKRISSVELTNEYLSKIAKLNGKLNCFITVNPEIALESAKQADKKIQSGEAGNLTGIPIAHKDIFCTKGVKSSCASKMLDNFISPYDATVVEKLSAQGIVTLGKTNMDEFAMGSSNENSYYGPVKNPWDLECVPGGSSGGSAAAVAARLVPAATGSDTGGSIRQPAAFCGITGIKPTYGSISRFGMIAFASSLDQAGPLAQTAEDCALLLQAMAGFDPKDSTSITQEIPNYTASLNNDINGLKIGIPQEYFDDNLSPKTSEMIHAAIAKLEKLGAKTIPISLPTTKLAVPVYYIIAPAECSSNLSRYDGVRFGHRCSEPKDLEDLYKRSRDEGFGTEVGRRIITGTYVLSSGYYDAYYIKAQKVRRLISEDFAQVFKEVDVIAGPTSPTTAFKIGEKSNDPISMYLSDIYTIGASLAGLPCMSLPAGFIDNKPIGLQLIGNHFNEAGILNVAHKYQQQTDWHTRLPQGVAL